MLLRQLTDKSLRYFSKLLQEKKNGGSVTTKKAVDEKIPDIHLLSITKTVAEKHFINSWAKSCAIYTCIVD